MKVIHIINNMNYSALYYIIGFMLDGFTQPEANISVLSVYKAGQAKL